MSAGGPVAAFFDRYATALSASDLDVLAECDHDPSLAVSRNGCLAITDPARTRAFLAQNGAPYRARGVVRIVDPRASDDEDGLWVGPADLENLDADGAHVSPEHHAYQLVRDGSGRWGIAVTTPLHAR
ncbi:hypothetical protein [Georgenia sp. H159]|uniref:hypothetical protein n=1 Tax=Georgenia sp. H159 TaxID=3076115 RepID=UPI002D769429|nr:hypothetical protein [Georgenia sp. H159]